MVLSFCELGDVDISPSVITDEKYERLHKDAQDLAAACKLFPLDFEQRMHLSGIFRPDIPNFEFNIATLPESIYDNCKEFNKAIEVGKLYRPFNNSRTMEELCMNTILFTTFVYNGQPGMGALPTELHLIANSVSL